MILTKKEVVGTLLIEDCITQEEAQMLLAKETDDFAKEEERVQIVSELLFGRLINPHEASALLDPNNNDLVEIPDFDYLFSNDHPASELVEVGGKIIKVKHSFVPITFENKINDEPVF